MILNIEILIFVEIINNIWIHPANGDAGSALGAAVVDWYKQFNKPRKLNASDSMKALILIVIFLWIQIWPSIS